MGVLIIADDVFHGLVLGEFFGPRLPIGDGFPLCGPLVGQLVKCLDGIHAPEDGQSGVEEFSEFFHVERTAEGFKRPSFAF